MSYKVILCDIEGTTTSISFVKDNLFPYAAKNVNSFLDAKWDDEDTREAVKMLRDQFAADKADNVDGCVEIVAATEDKAKQIESIVANVQWQMEHDRKAGPLKNLQGLMWVDAYKAGAFKGQVYSDVAPAFEKWTKAGRKVYIYSSGSAAIQKVHFEHSEAGDLAKFLSGYFDTKVGAKQEKSSYEAILKEVCKDDEALNAAEVLFLTDIPAEAKAAKEAGMEAILLKRPGNAELTEEQTTTYKVVESFADIVVGNEDQVAAKRKLEEEAQEDEVKPAKLAKMEEKKAPIDEDTEMKSTGDTEKETEKKDREEPPATTKTEEPATVEGTEKKPDEKEDVPMEEDIPTDDKQQEEQATPAPVVESPTTTEKTDIDEKKDQEKDKKSAEPEDKEKPEAKTEQEEEKMEVDSTTSTATSAKEANGEQGIVKEDEKVETETESKSKESVDEKKPQIDTEKPTETDKKEEKVLDDKKDVPDEKGTEANGGEEKQEVSNSTEVSNVTDDTKAALIDGEKTTNGDSETAVTNGKGTATAVDGADAVATNGHQDNDSDKENDKSMEAKGEEVSTTQEVTEAEEVPKKCASLDTVAVAPVAEVEAES